MPTEKPENAEFLRDVATHELKVIRDEGIYRHLRFKRPGTSCMYFDLITWPGHLCYTGDMGTYVFQRIEDMLEFFRREIREELPINPNYWSEKVIAADGGRHPGCVFEYDHGKFLAVVNEYLTDWLEGLSEEHQEELKEAVQDDVLRWADDHDEHGNYVRVYEFSAEVGGHKYQFTDIFERSMRRFTDRFIWCCRALVWGIGQYDAAKLAAAPQPEAYPFQQKVKPWLLDCFGEQIANDTTERNHRFLEEALELVQACGCTPDEAHKLVGYVFGRAVGERTQEVGGVMVTLAALCLAQSLDMHQAGEMELARITQPGMVERIREKQKRKPAMSPLPGVYPERAQQEQQS